MGRLRILRTCLPKSAGTRTEEKRRCCIPGSHHWEHSGDRIFAVAEGSRARGLVGVLGYYATVGSVLPLVEHEEWSPAGP